ncbi:hypothetical protein WG947_05200 [Pontibacter sp. H259]|uniref:hypothetical protein n=1 Tax=Pontibacter sp. H259 TaxID=3133421 RepID=UPI0030C05088
MNTIIHYLKWHEATGAMVCRATGITRANFCWYKRALEKVGKLHLVDRRRCLVTGRMAWYLTTSLDGYEFGLFELTDYEGYPRVAGRDYSDLDNDDYEL